MAEQELLDNCSLSSSNKDGWITKYYNSTKLFSKKKFQLLIPGGTLMKSNLPFLLRHIFVSRCLENTLTKTCQILHIGRNHHLKNTRRKEHSTTGREPGVIVNILGIISHNFMHFYRKASIIQPFRNRTTAKITR